MYAEVPPYFFTIVDAVGFYQQLYEVVIVFYCIEGFGYTGTGELIKYFCSVRFVTSVSAFPKRSVGDKGINIREKGLEGNKNDEQTCIRDEDANKIKESQYITSVKDLIGVDHWHVTYS